jgi:tetratricopeptide (TPR) repeat protein
MHGKPHWIWHLSALALGAALLLACGNSGRELVGSWKRVEGGKGYNQDVADFLTDGSCKSLEGGERRFCSWSERPGGVLLVRYGTDPDADLKAEIDGDRMQLKQGDHIQSFWIRAGSKLDGTMAVYTKGMSLIQAGDYEQGMAALKEAADAGLLSGQSSLAWNYATARDPRFQDGKKAVDYAEKAVAQVRDYLTLDTLAAALARDGQFKKAVDAETEALSLLEKNTSLPDEVRQTGEEQLKQRIDLYQGGQAYTEE